MFDFGARVQLHRFKLKVSDVHMDNKFKSICPYFLVISNFCYF